MPEGLASSPGWFWSIILRVCEDLERVKLFIERRTTRARPATVIRTAKQFNLTLAPNKALLGAAEIIFLRHKISSEGVGPDPGKVKDMKEMSMDRDVSQL